MDENERPLLLQREYYSDEEAKEILARAMAAPTVEGFSSGELVRFAGEMGISPEQLEVAERDWLAEHHERALVEDRRTFIAVRRRKAREEIIFVAALGAIAWAATTFSIPVLSTIAAVAMVPLVIITVITLLEALEAFTETDGEDFEKAFDKWLDRRERRRNRLAPPARRQLPPTS